MATLKYDISVIGMASIGRALKGLEGRLAAHNSRVKKSFSQRRSTRATSRTGAARAANRRAIAADGAHEERVAKRIHRIKRRNQLRRARSNRRSKQAEHRLELRNIAKEDKARARNLSRRQRQRRRGAGFVGRSAGGAVGAIGAGAASLLAIGGGFAVGNAINQEKSSRAKAAALANQAFGTAGGQGKTRQQLTDEAMGTARTLGKESGFGTAATLDAMREFQAISGTFRGGTDIADFMGDIADATDSDLSDIGKTSGQIFQSVHQSLAGMSNEEDRYATAMKKTKEIMAVVAGQAKEGSIEMQDMAQQMGKLMSVAGRFSGDITDLTATMGAFGQMAIAGGAASPEEAMTALANFANDIVKKGSKARGAFKTAGIDVFTDKSRTSLRDPAALMKEAVVKTKGDMGKLSSMFGMRGMKAVEPLRKIYTEAGGGEKGEAAMTKAIERFTKLAMTKQEIQESAAHRRAQADKEFDIAMSKFNDAMGKEMLPVLTKLIPKFVEMIPSLVKMAEGFASLAEFLIENPIKGIGAIILAKVAADVAAAGIGNALKGVVTGSVGAAGIGAAIVAAIALYAAKDQYDKLQEEIDQFNKEQKDTYRGALDMAEQRGDSQAVVKEDFATRLFTGDESQGRDWSGTYTGNKVISRDKDGRIVVRRQTTAEAKRDEEGPVGAMALERDGGMDLTPTLAGIRKAHALGYDVTEAQYNEAMGIEGGSPLKNVDVEALLEGSNKLSSGSDKLDAAAANLSAAGDKLAAGANRGPAPTEPRE